VLYKAKDVPNEFGEVKMFKNNMLRCVDRFFVRKVGYVGSYKNVFKNVGSYKKVCKMREDISIDGQ
jgi:hypothetical protein